MCVGDIKYPAYSTANNIVKYSIPYICVNKTVIPINFPDETLTDEHLIERGMIVELEHPLLGVIKTIGSPINMSGGGPSYRRYPPRLGEHNEEIALELANSLRLKK